MKNKKPIIGIISRPSSDGENNLLTVVESYRQAIILSGGIPFLILPPQLAEYEKFNAKELPLLTDEEKEMLDAELEFCDGVLLPGGTRRYEYDRYITNYCLDNDVPVLGICLGMQLLATHINRDTLDFVNEECTHAKPGINEVHTVKLDKNSQLFNIIGMEEFYVNSRHRYKVTETGDLSIVGYSNDGVIEAIEHKDKKFAIGVQWHPENLMDTIPSKNLFNRFIESCKK